MTDETTSDGAISVTSLSTLLEQIAEAQAVKAKLDDEAKAAGKKLRELERLAVEHLAVSGLDGVRAAGKSWYLREFFSVSIPEQNKEQVLKIARTECPEYIGVNTASLKSWLMERRKQADGDAPESLADGTPFAGLIEEYREMRLSHLTLR